MAPTKYLSRPSSKPSKWARYAKHSKKSVLSSLKRKLQEGPEVPTGPSEKLGRYAPVHPEQTTLARCLGPFEGRKFVELVYWQTPLLQATTAGGSFLAVVSNGAFDFDNTNALGNKQPLYYDTLLTTSGPYKSYKVISWKTTWTFVNASTLGVNIWVSPPVTASSEVDAVGEVDDFPGVKKLTLTAESGSKSMGTLNTTGHVRDVYPGLPFSTTLVGAFNSNPTSTCVQTVVYQPADGAAVTKLYVGVKHVMYVELGQVDSIVS